MIVYTVTVSVDRAAAAEWLSWMTSTHIPDVMRAGYFRSHSIRRVLEPVEHEGKDTFVIEYTCESQECFDAYQREAAPALQRDHNDRFAGRVKASRRVSECPPGAGVEMYLSGGAWDPHDPDVVSAIDDLPLWSAPFGLALLERVRMRAGMRVLDVGSGLGFPILELSQRLGNTCRVWGIDPWTEAVERARMKIRTWGATNVEIIEGRAEAMPFEDGFFDLVVSNNGTNNVGDDACEARVFKEIARVARPGAQVIFIVNTPGTMAEFYDAFREVLRARGLDDAVLRLERHIFEKRRPLEHLRATVEGAGLEIERVDEGSFRMRFVDGTAMLDHFLIKFAFLESWRHVVAPGVSDAVFAEVRQRLDGVAKRDGELRLTVPWVCIDATRPAAGS